MEAGLFVNGGKEEEGLGGLTSFDPDLLIKWIGGLW